MGSKTLVSQFSDSERGKQWDSTKVAVEALRFRRDFSPPPAGSKPSTQPELSLLMT